MFLIFFIPLVLISRIPTYLGSRVHSFFISKSRVVFPRCYKQFFGIGILRVSDLLGGRYFRSVLLIWRELLFSAKGGLAVSKRGPVPPFSSKRGHRPPFWGKKGCPIFRIRPPIASLLIFLFPIFMIQTCNDMSLSIDSLFQFPISRNRPPIALLFVFCFPYTWIVTWNPTTLSPPCQTQTSRIGTFYHNIIFWLEILKGLVAKQGTYGCAYLQNGCATYQYGCAPVALLWCCRTYTFDISLCMYGCALKLCVCTG